MHERYSWSWIEMQVNQTAEVWHSCAGQPAYSSPRYSLQEKRRREKAYDQALQDVEQVARRSARRKGERIKMQDRVTASFARFSASALDLPEEAIHLLTHDFLPVGTALARWARQFDPSLEMPGIIQACRNAWTACGLQPLLGNRLEITPSILGYSLLYPYSDNYLDREDLSAAEKICSSQRFLGRLRGEALAAQNHQETALWALVALIEQQYPRNQFPQVFDCLYAIHRAQEESIAQLQGYGLSSDIDILRMSCAKGGSSVLTDACLAHGWLDKDESRFAFHWGVLLQLGDDLQDVEEDRRRGSVTLFTKAIAEGRLLDDVVVQLLNFSAAVAAQMDHLPNGSTMLKDLLRMSWRSLILGAVANSYQYFSPSFLTNAEECSPFHFDFLRARSRRMASKQGLYEILFDAFLEEPQSEKTERTPALLPLSKPAETIFAGAERREASY